MIIVAKFKGTASLGYIPGDTYRLKITGSTICRVDGSGACPYKSLESFFKNWDVI